MHLLQFAPLLLTISALRVPHQPRGVCEDTQDDEVEYNDGPTADRTAGLGAEFESPGWQMTSQGCSAEDTFKAKKKVIGGRHGENWELTADTPGDPGVVQAEYILDGRNIKVGSGDGERAGRELADDLKAWKPWENGDGNLDIEDNNCNPWKTQLPKIYDPEKLPWAPQITTPMPLDALYSLMKEQVNPPANYEDENILNGVNPRFNPPKLVLVRQEYFQAKPNGIDPSSVTDDVLAFCSLILTYAKAATELLRPNQSPKLFSTFMPRTEFNTMFQFVKPKLPGDLFDLFIILACYQTDKNGVKFDKTYCKGTLSKPIPNENFAKLEYVNSAAKGDDLKKVNIKDWIQGISKGSPSPDLLSQWDKGNDGSIGGLGTALEKIFESDRAAPLIEFRDLDTKSISKIEHFMKDVDSAVQKLHKSSANAPSKRKRDDADCALPTTPTNIPQPTCDKKVTNVETSLIESLATAFCKGVDLSKEVSRDMTNKDAGTDTYQDFKFNLKWEPKKGAPCNLNCATIFDHLPGCAYNSHSAYKSGSIETDCGTASYAITEPNDDDPKPPPTNANDPPSGSAKSIVDCNNDGKDRFGSSVKKFSRDKAFNAIQKQCTAMHDNKIKIWQTSGQGKAQNYYMTADDKDIVEDGTPLALTISYNATSCEDVNKPHDVDFGTLDPDADCVKFFLTAVDGCPALENPGKDEFWKWGGVAYGECLNWGVKNNV